MKNCLRVTGLSGATTDQNLRDAFGAYGQVIDATVVRDGPLRRSHGYGFIRFADRRGARMATMALNGSSLQEHTIVVHAADGRAALHERGRGGE